MDIQKAKAIVSDYLYKAKATETKIAAGYRIYQEDAMQEHEKRLRDELAKERAVAESKLDEIYNDARREAQAWGKLDGKALTADAELLKGEGVSPEQFADLVGRYQNNATMLDALKKYGERRNHEGNGGLYDVSEIPTVEGRMQEAEAMRKRAGYFLDVSDGRGMDKFTLDLSRAAADREFDAWGTEEEHKPEKHPGMESGFADALVNAWGYKK